MSEKEFRNCCVLAVAIISIGCAVICDDRDSNWASAQSTLVVSLGALRRALVTVGGT